MSHQEEKYPLDLATPDRSKVETATFPAEGNSPMSTETQIDCPALRKRSNSYPFGDRVPRAVRMLKTVTADPMPGIGLAYIKGDAPVAKAGQTYLVWTNSHGAVAAVMPDGSHLGLRPAEFEVDAWHDLSPAPGGSGTALHTERSTVTKLVITGAPRLDPITVFLEDFGRRAVPTDDNPNYETAQGKITINCWDKSWSAYWGGMGPRTVAEFVADCGWDYVLNCLDRGISPTVFSGNALHALAKTCIVQRRRQQTGRHDWELGDLSKSEARQLWDDIDVLRSIESSSECGHQSALLTSLFGDEWHYPLDGKAVEENHDYTYLRLIVEAAQQALRQQKATPTFEPNYQRMFMTAIESLAVIDKALGISEETHIVGGAGPALHEIQKLKDENQRLTGERDALQPRLNAADQRIDELGSQPLESRKIMLSGCEFSEHELVGQAVRAATGTHRRGTQRWVAIMDAFCCGSGVAHALCRRFGFDPDEMVKP
ncbi:hypothetical protein [Pseudomonas syringae]|uniref:hypothetical protein n=1 Tax=Pseudomonas syringae TaxID=317 RepID=UPI000A5EB765|nr:hypothetical protein [Pseudomonas syringae]